MRYCKVVTSPCIEAYLSIEHLGDTGTQFITKRSLYIFSWFVINRRQVWVSIYVQTMNPRVVVDYKRLWTMQFRK